MNEVRRAARQVNRLTQEVPHKHFQLSVRTTKAIKWLLSVESSNCVVVC